MSDTLTKEMVEALTAPLPKEALKEHPTKNYLTTINAAYVIERLNKVFGVNGWDLEPEVIEKEKMVVVRGVLSVPKYGIRKVAFGGNDNPDRGDAFKGASTDALTKAASFLGIGAEVYKNEVKAGHEHTPQAPPPVAKVAAQNQQTSKPVQQPQQARPQFNETGEIQGDLLYCNPSVGETDGQYGKYLELEWMAKIEGKPRPQHAKHFPNRKNQHWPHIYNAIKESHAHRSVFKTERKGKYLNIVDVISIDGRDYENGVPVIQINEDVRHMEPEPDDIPF